MPIYEFQCERCGAAFEKLVYSGDDAELACPKCGAVETRKLVSRTGCVGGQAGESCSVDAPKGFS